MKHVEYNPASNWSGEHLQFEDEFGNDGIVMFPHLRERGFGQMRVPGQWQDAEVRVHSSVGGSADEVAATAEFAMVLARVAKVLDLACAKDKEEAIGRAQREEEERKDREERRKRATQVRCEELSQYYMQMVRVQREGHSSNSKGELHVRYREEADGSVWINPRMIVRESNGNMWDFRADAVAKFEVKDGNRYKEIKLKSMQLLQAEAGLASQEES